MPSPVTDSKRGRMLPFDRGWSRANGDAFPSTARGAGCSNYGVFTMVFSHSIRRLTQSGGSGTYWEVRMEGLS